MSTKVLVLNQDYTAMGLCSVNKAFLLIFLEKAEMVTYIDGRYLRTVSSSYPWPSVIRLFSYVHIPFKSVVLSRQNILKRDNHQCQYCGATHDLTMDHILPRSRNGKSTWLNLVTACKLCNSKKGDFTPEEAGMPLRRAPFKPTFIFFLREFHGIPHDSWLQFLNSKTKTA